MYHLGYSGSCTRPGSDLALAHRVRGDNSGPHTPEEIAAMHAELAAMFPNAEITACNLSDMAKALQPFALSSPSLPRR